MQFLESFRACVRLLRSCVQEGEPARTGLLAQVERHPIWHMLCATVIFAHLIVMIHFTNEGVTRTSHDINDDETMVEDIFLAFYISELVLNMMVHRLYVFVNESRWWNLLDIMLIVVSFPQLLVADVGGTRLIRICKVARALRVMKVLRLSREIRLMVDVLVGSFYCILCSLVLLCFFICVFSLYFVQSVSLHGSRGTMDPGTLALLNDMFGSVEAGMVSLFKSTCGGLDWGDVFTPMAKASSMDAFMFLLFMVFFMLVVLNIVTILFMDKAVQLAKPELLEAIRREELQDQEMASVLREACSPLAESGKMTRRAFLRHIRDPALMRVFKGANLNFHSPDIFFDVLTYDMEDRDFMELSDFVQKCVSVRGPFCALQLQAAAASNHQDLFEKYCAEQFQAIAAALRPALAAPQAAPASEAAPAAPAAPAARAARAARTAPRLPLARESPSEAAEPVAGTADAAASTAGAVVTAADGSLGSLSSSTPRSTRFSRGRASAFSRDVAWAIV